MPMELSLQYWLQQPTAPHPASVDSLHQAGALPSLHHWLLQPVGGRGGGFIASSRGLGLELLVVAANPPSPQQAENWPRGFHQSQKTVSSALQAYRFCPMAAEKKRKDGVNLMRSQSIIPACPGLWLQLNWPSSKGKG